MFAKIVIAITRSEARSCYKMGLKKLYKMMKIAENKLHQIQSESVSAQTYVLVIACSLFFFCSTLSFAAVENLDEVVARKSRLSTATWGYSFLQNDANNYTWQPETLNYTDATTGNEVWRFTHTPTGVGGRTQDLSITHWNANGNRVFFHSTRATNAFSYANGINPIWMLSNTDGSRLKPAKGAAAQFALVDAYPLWSPIIPDVMYQSAANEGRFPDFNDVYKTVTSDTTISYSTFLTVPLLTTGTTMKLTKGLSSDGRKLRIIYGGKHYPATVYPEASKALDVPAGYSEILNLDGYWGGFTMPTTGTIWHENKVTGAVNGVDGIWALLMPEVGTGPFWRGRLTGSSAEGGPLHVIDRTIPYSWGGELEPMHTSGDGKDKPTPWCEDGVIWDGINPCVVAASNLDHASPDRWARFTTSGGAPSQKYWDMRNHTYVGYIPSLTKVSHHDWEAWSDYSTESGYPGGDPYPPTYIAPASGELNPQSVWANNYKTGNSINVAYTHARYNDTANPPYSANARPTQSPDGTKIMFNSTFLVTSDSNVQLFWAVAHYPYPPEIKLAAKVASNVRLTWDFNQGSSCSNNAGTTPRTGPTPNFSTPRTYATRGWPHETLDCPPSPREIKQFRVWTSSDNSAWTPAGTTTYNNCSGTNECGMWTETTWTYDYAQANSTTRYYAITSLEHSGLESRTLGNVWKVALDADGNILQQFQQSAYPAAPGGKSSFYTTKPGVPTDVLSAHKKIPAIADGQYTVTWKAPLNNSLIRYYNIYALDGSVPTAVQQRRIASIPSTSDYTGSGNYKYIDWLGATDGTTKFVVTAVDFQGNESIFVDGAPRALTGL
jgi:hypothetical protein